MLGSSFEMLIDDASNLIFCPVLSHTIDPPPIKGMARTAKQENKIRIMQLFLFQHRLELWSVTM